MIVAPESSETFVTLRSDKLLNRTQTPYLHRNAQLRSKSTHSKAAITPDDELLNLMRVRFCNKGTTLVGPHRRTQNAGL